MLHKIVLKNVVLHVSVILLPLSIGFMAVGITLILLGNLDIPRFFLSIPSIGSGFLLLYAGFCLKNRMRFLFSSSFLLLTGGLFLFRDLGLLYITTSVIWPLLMLFIGISFSVSGAVYYRKLHPVYIAPAFAFAGLGFVFLLFSTSIIRVSIRSLVLWWLPLLLLPSIISFSIWLFRKNRKDKDENE